MLALPAIELRLLVLGLAVDLHPDEHLHHQPPAGLPERLSRTFEALDETSADEGDNLLQAAYFEGSCDVLAVALVVGIGVVNTEHEQRIALVDRKSTRLNSTHNQISLF